MALTIRLTEGEKKLMEQLKSKLGVFHNSKALMKAAHIVVYDYSKIKAEKRRLEDELYEQQCKYANLDRFIRQKIEAERNILKYMEDGK